MVDLIAEEQAMVAKIERFVTVGSDYAKQHSTQPQTLGYGLTDVHWPGRLDLREDARVGRS